MGSFIPDENIKSENQYIGKDNRAAAKKMRTGFEGSLDFKRGCSILF